MRKTRFWEACQDTGVEYYLYNHTESELFFTEEEEEKGRVLLAEMGIGADDWFVCFHARSENFGLLTLVAVCPHLANSGRSARP